MSNAHANQTSQMLENFSLLRGNEFDECKNSLLKLSLKNASKDCALLLISRGATCDPNEVLRDCLWKNIDKVHQLLVELIKSDTTFIGKNTFWYTDKKSIIGRLIEPTKVEDNPDRIEYVMQLMKDGFFTAQDIREVYNKNYKDKPRKAHMLMIVRELTLNELGL